MAQKTVGYVELEWKCKRCGTLNPGTSKTCESCGAPMDASAQFELPSEQKLVADQAKIKQAQQGPDLHCPYCGARNLATVETCSQCGASLKEASQRQAGQVLGAYQEGRSPDVACPSCNSSNPPDAAFCIQCGANLAKPVQAIAAPGMSAAARRRFVPIGTIILALICLAGLAILYLGSRTQAMNGRVQSIHWERRIEIQALGPVQNEDWKDQIPSDAAIGTCTQRYRLTQSEPAAGAEEICGTPYTVDTGSGMGKVVQDCEYKIYDAWCSYTQQDWTTINEALAQGDDLSPHWPVLSLQTGQREGEQQESYIVQFDVSGKAYRYVTDDPQEFATFIPGSQWVLKINPLGGVQSTTPK
jgi:DNA-directed RNA polymerase subunit RPC12/RpoP